jgi:DNA-binding MarR family transcriptional regulator
MTTTEPIVARRHSATDVERYLATMSELHRRFSRTVPDDLRQQLEGVTTHQCEALVFVVRQAPVTMNDVARHFGVSVSSCTALVDRLQRQGLVERAADPADRRVVRVVPTDSGLQLVERFLEHKRGVARTAISALTRDELDTLLSLIRRMLASDVPSEELA